MGLPMELAALQSSAKLLHQLLPAELGLEETVSVGVADWGSLSEELVEHIFARMPIKEAVRASCVCRQWQSIVDSRSFVTFILQFRIQKHQRP